MKKLFLVVALLASTVSAFAQDDKGKKENDPLDVSAELNKISEYGVPTIQLIDQMKTKADNLFESQSWAEAIEAYDEYAKKANWLANLISQCLAPYYSASYDDRKNVSYSSLKKYIPYESAANSYKKNRNQAYVRIGLCYKELGNVEKAVAYLYKGLDLVDINSSTDWGEAVKAMSEIIGYSAE